MNKLKQTKVSYINKDKAYVKINDPFFRDITKVDDIMYEFEMNKKSHKLNNPIHVSIAIYQLAKLKMLEFYYDCVDKYIDRSDFQYLSMDTDSAYIAFTDEHPFENLIKKDMINDFQKNKYKFFPRDYDEKLKKYDKRTPGLFKEEFICNKFIGLNPKNYICENLDKKTSDDQYKISCKGVKCKEGKVIRYNKDILTIENFESVIQDNKTFKGNNYGIKLD